MIPLGHFDLIEPLARGGMGEVWRGIHREQGLPVAVKVLTNSVARTDRVHAAFAREVRAMARLVHPRIVVILDHGTVGAEAERLSAGALTEGSPTLVMELGKGTVTQWVNRRGIAWSGVRDVLLQVLDALAYGHARGVIHRDLKPSNLLRFGDKSSPEWKLTDYGIAVDLGEMDDTPLAGTVTYMAPEQVTASRGVLGPWTDLYALGCLGWTLTTGAPPYRGPPPVVMHAHLTAPLPFYRPYLDVPRALSGWLATLLAKSPARRFRRAADAAWALANLSEETMEGGERFALEPPSETQVFTICDLPTPRLRDHLSAPIPASSLRERPPVPRSFARPEIDKAPPRLLSAGLGLFGLREIPMVGREQERSVLWSALRAAVDGQLQVVVLSGPAGIGKSRMARWLCERSHEVGSAETAFASHGHGVGGLSAMIERSLRCWGLPRPDLVALLRSEHPMLPQQDLSELVELIRPREDDQPAGDLAEVQLKEPADRHRVLTRYLEVRTAARPVVLWMDDVQWGHASLRFLHHLVAERPTLPLLTLLTVRDEAKTAETDALLDGLPATRLVISPLSADARRALIQELLRLDTSLAAEVDARTQGHPLFAVQLVGDWVTRGVLVVGKDGFELHPGATAELPEAIDGLWNRRVDRLLSDRAADDEATLEVAGLLGQRVDADVWRSACERAGLLPDPRLWEALIAQGLATADAAGFSFVHGLLAESLAARGSRSGRVASHADAIIEVLRDLAQGTRPSTAAPLLMQAVRLARSHRPEKWSQLASALALSHRHLGEVDEARHLLEVALRDAREEGDRAMEAQLLRNHGDLYRDTGRMALAEETYVAALAVFREQGDEEGAGLVLNSLGNVHSHSCRPTEAQTCYEAAIVLLRRTGHRKAEGSALANLGLVELGRGRLREAAARFERALEVHRETGNRRNEAIVLSNLGLVLTDFGRLEDAQAYATAALAIHRELGNRRGEGDVLTDLGRMHLVSEHLPAAHKALEEAVTVHREMSNPGGEGAALLYLAELQLRQGSPEAAQQSARLSSTIAEGIGHPTLLGRSLVVLAEADDNPDTAQELMERGVQILSATENRLEHAVVTCRYARLAHRHERHEEASRALASAIVTARELGVGSGSPLGRAITGTRQLLGQ